MAGQPVGNEQLSVISDNKKYCEMKCIKQVAQLSLTNTNAIHKTACTSTSSQKHCITTAWDQKREKCIPGHKEVHQELQCVGGVLVNKTSGHRWVTQQKGNRI